MRLYKSGTRYCVWRWTNVAWRGVRYLTRLHLFKTPRWFAMLHWILAPDPHLDPHDHPVSFLSITLRGGYVEERYRAGNKPHGAPMIISRQRRRFRWISQHDIHRIVKVDPGTLTLCIGISHDATSRVWGFHTKDGVVDWRTYRKASEA